jgi:DNA-directed RNA polymerase subunit RPC12/RpoP
MANKLTKASIWFKCRDCDKRLRGYKDEIGDEIECPRCQSLVFVPPRSTCPPPLPKRSAVPWVIPVTQDQEDSKTVDVNVGLPQVGSLKTKVTQKTADSMASTFLGGILVAMGVLLTSFLGGKRA